jgi:hypothetical protein
MPNGKVFFVYARSCDVKSTSEFVFAEHKEFFYDFANSKLIYFKHGKAENTINNELIDKPNPQYSILKVRSDINSYSDAFNELNLMALDIITNNASRKTIKLNIQSKSNVHHNVG